jgi:predicted Rossmann fold nucleotide-binding protein DprA/Smf involved in DNA uptake
MKRKFELVRIAGDDKRYPLKFRALGTEAPPELTAIGNTDLLDLEKYGLICSVKCPGSIILKTYEYVKGLASTNLALTSGFQSPMEKECLRIFLRAKAPLVPVLARAIETLRIPREWKGAINEKRLLILSPFSGSSSRVTSALAEKRNQVVASLGEKIIIPYAAAGSKTEALAKRIVANSIVPYTFDDAHNTNLLSLGAIPLPLI